MKKLIISNKLAIAGIFLGAIAGYLYFNFYGCTNGCTITSKPLNSTLFGAVMGGLFLSMFKKEQRQQ